MVGMFVCSAGPQEWERLWRGTGASWGHLLAGVVKSCFGGAGQVGWVGLILRGMPGWCIQCQLGCQRVTERCLPVLAQLGEKSERKIAPASTSIPGECSIRSRHSGTCPEIGQRISFSYVLDTESSHCLYAGTLSNCVSA